MRFLIPAAAAVLVLFTPAAAQQSNPAGRSASCVGRTESGSLAGTRWRGRASWGSEAAKEWTAYFRPDCVLEYGYGGVIYTNGRWVQRNRLISWDTNDYFSLYSGVVEGGAMSGTMVNQRGDRGTWSFTRAR